MALRGCCKLIAANLSFSCCFFFLSFFFKSSLHRIQNYTWFSASRSQWRKENPNQQTLISHCEDRIGMICRFFRIFSHFLKQKKID